MFRRVRGEGVGPRNLSKICLPDSRFAYEKFAYVSKEIPTKAKGWGGVAALDVIIRAPDI